VVVGKIASSVCSAATTVGPTAPIEIAVGLRRMSGMSIVLSVGGCVIGSFGGLCQLCLIVTFCFGGLDGGEAIIKLF
jgi:hypothetical protein